MVSRTRARTCLVDVLLTGVPDAGMEAAEQEAVVPGLPAVVHFAWIRLVHAVVDAVVAPLLAAVGLGHALGPLAPVGGDEGGGGEEEREQVEGHRHQRAAFPRGLHDVLEAKPRNFVRSSERGPQGGEGVHGTERTHGGVTRASFQLVSGPSWEVGMGGEGARDTNKNDQMHSKSASHSDPTPPDSEAVLSTESRTLGVCLCGGGTRSPPPPPPLPCVITRHSPPSNLHPPSSSFFFIRSRKKRAASESPSFRVFRQQIPHQFDSKTVFIYRSFWLQKYDFRTFILLKIHSSGVFLPHSR